MAEKHIKHYLNGATLIYYRQNINSTTDATIGFLCGARKDGKKKGLAHALEHSIFDGFDDVKKEDLYQIFRQTGTVQNAFTSNECIATEFNTPNATFEQILKLNSDMFSKRNFSEYEWKRERKVILQELYMTVDGRRTIENLAEEMKLKDKILGSPETLNQITTKDFTTFADKYFITDNMVISVVSSLPYNEVKRAVENNFINKFPKNSKNKVRIKVKPVKFEDEQIIKDIPYAQSFDIQFMFKGLNGVEKNDLYTRFEDWYFNNFAGKLYERFRVKEPLVYTSSFFNYPVLNSNLKLFAIKTSPNNVNKCIDAMTEILRDVIMKGVTEEDFKLFKEAMLAERARKTNIKTYDATDLFFDYIYGSKPFVRNFFNKLMALKREDVNSYLKRVYGQSKLIVLLSGDIVKGQNMVDVSKYPMNAVSNEKLFKDMLNVDEFYNIDEILDKFRYYQIIGLYDEVEKMKQEHPIDNIEYTGKLPKVKKKDIINAWNKTKKEKQEKIKLLRNQTKSRYSKCILKSYNGELPKVEKEDVIKAIRKTKREQNKQKKLQEEAKLAELEMKKEN